MTSEKVFSIDHAAAGSHRQIPERIPMIGRLTVPIRSILHIVADDGGYYRM